MFRTRLDRPGELARLSALLARLRVNILEVRHHVRGVALGVNEVELELTVETRNVAHGEQVLARLRDPAIRRSGAAPRRPGSARATAAAASRGAIGADAAGQDRRRPLALTPCSDDHPPRAPAN